MKTGAWIKARASNGNGGNNCVEIKFLDERILVRDSKNQTGPILQFNPDAWDAFVEGIKMNEFDR